MGNSTASHSRSALNLQRTAVLALLCALAMGCSGNRPVQTEVLLNHHNCKTLDSGVTEIAVNQVARIRGSRLLQHPNSQAPDAALSAADQTALSSATRVFAISKGPMPTPGYGFAMDGADLTESTLTVRLGWQEPAADALLPQQLTHPCLVVALPIAEAKTLVVRTGDAELGRLPL